MATTKNAAPIRNIALLGHPNAGKTSLAEALLHRGGVISRQGSVTEGTTVCDHEPEAIARGISVSLAIASMPWTYAGTTYDVTMLDTPGYPDFAGSVDAALAVADLGVIAVSAVDGVQAGTEDAWRACERAGIPRLIVVTKEDRPRADFRAVVDQLRAAFGDAVVPLELPIGEEDELRGVADVLAEKAYGYDAKGNHRTEKLDEDLAEEERDLHSQVVEEIVSHDDEQLERYLEGDEPGAAELATTLAREVCDREAVPIVLCSTVTEVGIDRVADLLCILGPSPSDRPAKVLIPGADGDEVLEIDADPQGDQLAQVFRMVADPFVGQVSVLKVLSGTFAAGDRVFDVGTGTEERLHGFFALRGREHVALEQAVAGQIVAVAKLSNGSAGTLLAGRTYPVKAVPAPQRPAVYKLALKPETQADDDKLSAALARLTIEDPTLSVDLTGSQAVLGGLGDTHLAVTLDRLARVFGVHVTTEPVQVAYRETIAKPADVEGKLKKQSGGHGQYAVVQLKVSPLPRGKGFEFVDSVVGGSVPRNYIPAVEKGIIEAMAAGGPNGYPVVDLRVELYDGKAHAVDSSDMAFRTAAALGLREAFQKAGALVLEPVCAVSVTVPNEGQGDVMGDLSTRRGRITSTSAVDEGMTQVDALVPEAELARYVLDLRSLTGGRGSFVAVQDRYEVTTA